MSAPNVDELLQVNGYHGNGRPSVRDREQVAKYVQQLHDENAMLKGQLYRLLRTLQLQQIKMRGRRTA
jgi:hypothetical protein